MRKLRDSLNYIRSGAFLTPYVNEWLYSETCKELAGNRFKGTRCLRYYVNKCSERVDIIQAYFDLLKFNKKVELEDIEDSTGIKDKFIFVGYLDNVVEFEIAAILVKTICSGKLDRKPISLDSLTGKYFTLAVLAILKNLPKFLERLSDEMLEKCSYNFNNDYGHGGLVNWSSKRHFKKKRVDKTPTLA